MSKLQRQLQQIAGQQAPIAKKSKASILFSGKQAADIDRETIFTLAANALETMIKIDSSFKQFSNTLFSAKFKEKDRLQMTREENNFIDGQVTKFLLHVSPYFLQTEAVHLLEWLIRRFSINEFNVDQVIDCILPFHGTKPFVQFVSILAIAEDSKWSFLKSSQKKKEVLHRTVIVQRCIQDASVLDSIIQNFKKSNKMSINNKTLISFYSSVAIEYVKSLTVIDNNHLRQLLPHVIEDIKSSNLEIRASAQMILVLISKRCAFEKEILAEIFNNAGKELHKSNIRITILTLVTLCQSQPDIVTIPSKLANRFIKANLLDEFISISEEFESDKFLLPFLISMVDLIIENDEEVAEFCKSIFIKVSLAEEILKTFFKKFIKHLARSETLSEIGIAFLKSVYNRYFNVIEDVISELLMKKVRSNVFEILTKSFNGTVSEAFTPANTTLFMALENPDSRIRISALERLEEILDADSSQSEENMDQFVKDALLARLKDESCDVVSFVLDLPQLARFIPQGQLIDEIRRILVVSNDYSLIVKAMSILLSMVKNLDPIEFQKVFATIMESLLLKSFDQQTIKYAKSCFPAVFEKLGYSKSELKGLLKIFDSSEDAQDTCLKLNHQVIALLAGKLKDAKYRALFVDCLESTSEKRRVLSLLVLNYYYFKNRKDLEIAKALSRLCKNLNRYTDLKLSKEVYKISEEGLPSLTVQNLIFSDSWSQVEGYMSYFTVWNVISNATNPNRFEGWFGATQNFEKLIYALFESICEICTIPVRDKFLQKLLKTHCHGSVIEFTCSVSTYSDKYASKAVALHIIQKLIIGNNQLKHLDYQLVIPSVLIALSDSSKQIRKLAIDCLQSIEIAARKIAAEGNGKKSIQQVYGFQRFYGNLTKNIQYLTTKTSCELAAAILNRKSEIIADNSYAALSLPEILKDSKKKTPRSDYVCFLCSNVLGFSTSTQQIKLLDCLSNIHSSEKATIVEPLLDLQITASSKGDSSFDETLLERILNCYTSHCVKDILKSTSFFNKFLGLFKTPSSQSETVLSSHALKIITKDWFDSIDIKSQTKLLSLMIDLVVQSPAEISSIAKTQLSGISVHSDSIQHKLQDLCQSIFTDAPSKRSKTDQAKKDDTIILSIDAVLEFIQYNKLIKKKYLLTSALLDALNNLLSLDSKDNLIIIEYAKQMILTILLDIVHKMNPGQVAEEDLRVDLIVQCIRATDNPQTHGIALLLLAEIGKKYPDLVLVNIMPVFTFMGANILRHDDNYSFQVVQKTLETVIPALLKDDQTEQIYSILKVFVNAVQHVPSHRRLRLFTNLIETLGKSDYLGTLISLLVTHDIGLSQTLVSSVDSFDKIQFSLAILSSFTVDVELKAISDILRIGCLKETENLLFNEKGVDEQTKIKYQQQIFSFANQAMTFEPIVESIRGMNEMLVPKHVRLVNEIISAIDHIKVQQTEGNRSAILVHLKACLHGANIVLSLPAFLGVVAGLLKKEDQVKREAFLLLEERLKTIDAENFDNLELFEPIFDHLILIIKNDSNHENIQLALICLSLMASLLGSKDMTRFSNLLEVLNISLNHKNDLVKVTAVVTVSKFAELLGPRMVPSISKIMPLILNFTEHALKLRGSKATEIVSSTFAALCIIVETIPMFITSYIKRLLSIILNSKVYWQESIQLCGKIGRCFEHRVLFPTVLANVSTWIGFGFESFLRLSDIIGILISSTGSSILLEFRNEWIKLFIACFDYRKVFNSKNENELEAVDEKLIKVFIDYTMKMNEKVFKPLFFKLSEWGCKGNEDQRILIFKLTDSLLDSLKSIFVPYMGLVFDSAIESLQSANSMDASWFLSISILTKCFLNDKDDFTTQERFDKSLGPLSAQLEHLKWPEYEILVEHVARCFGALAVAKHDDPTLKILNKQALLKARHSNSKVRKAAIRILSELYFKLGEEMLNLFPETIPYLAELMEDEDSEVEAACQDLCGQIQNYLGEPIQQYFNAK